MRHAATTALCLAIASTSARASGGLELTAQGALLINDPGVFASALHGAWAKASPGFCSSFAGTFATRTPGRVTGCDNVALDVSSDFLAATANAVQLATTLPKIVVHLSWVQANKAVCNADVTLRAGLVFPLQLTSSANSRYSGDGVVQQLGFGAPIPTFELTDSQVVWHGPAPCTTPPLYSASTLTVPIEASLNDALSNLGFPGTVVNDALAPFTAQILSQVSLHSYAVAATGGDLVFTVGGSRLSDKAIPLPAPVAKAAASGAPAAPTWSTPAATSPPAPAAAVGSLRTSRPFTPGATGQAPLAPSALGSH